MKRLVTLFICLLLLQIAKGSTAAPTGGPVKFPQKKGTDTTFAHAANQLQTLHETVIERRLDSIKKDVPLDYNEFVQNYIDLYSHNRDEMGHVIGLSKYYFPIYEKVFHDAGIPEEIKYLSIVESKLDPNAVSRVGATGPWQFMSTTAKLYGLNMDGYIDERRDPIKASYAAAAYLKDAYEEFGDWLLAIASYNCGKSNVENALAKSGGTDFWSIRQYLPVETRNYVPAYIAVAYVMNYYSQQNINAQPCGFSLNVDTVLVDRYVSLTSIAHIINVDVSVLSLLNPAYRMQSINASSANPRRLVIPQANTNTYTALYNALNIAPAGTLTPQKAYVPIQQEGKADQLPAYHKVKKGETLAAIADKYGVDVQDLKAWNHLGGLKKAHLQPGMTLKISRG